LTTPKPRLVAWSAAPSQDQAKPLLPCRPLQGAKWSEHIAAWNPAASAATTHRNSALGESCSWEAW
jgi:hypothetical protein